MRREASAAVEISAIMTKEGTRRASSAGKCSEREGCCGEGAGGSVARAQVRLLPAIVAVIFCLGSLEMWPVRALALLSKEKIGVHVKVPRDAEYGHSVLLRCTWSLPRNNSTLYSVKWYKDEYEFFSYMPDNEPDTRIKTYPQRGVHIDVRSSNKTAVRLTQLTLNSTGQYKCEVSTGAPYYATNYAMDNLTVIVLPNHEPEITGLGSQYAVGENLTANCTAWPSVPKAVITWVINGVEAPSHQVIEYPARRDEVPVTYTGIPSILGLRMDVSSSHLTRNQGTLTVVCRAPVGSRKFEALKRVRVTHANNQRLSAGDLRSAGFAARAAPLVIAVLLVALTT